VLPPRDVACWQKCCKSLFAAGASNSPSRRRDDRIIMWGTTLPCAKLTGDSANGFETTLIGDCRWFRPLVRTEKAEVAKLQCSTERPDEQPPESPQLEAGRKAAPTKAVAPSAARSGSPNGPGKVHARILLLGGFDQNTQPHHDQSDCRTEI
jgi:hypothetical protein